MLTFFRKGHEFYEMQEFFNENEPAIFYKTHYEIARMPDAPASNPQEWKNFLTEGRVAEYVNQELQLLQQTEMRKLLENISSKSRSVGTAQTLTAMIKSIESNAVKEGPIFIYTYVPLTEEEMNALNVVVLDHDPFKREI